MCKVLWFFIHDINENNNLPSVVPAQKLQTLCRVPAGPCDLVTVQTPVHPVPVCLDPPCWRSCVGLESGWRGGHHIPLNHTCKYLLYLIQVLKRNYWSIRNVSFIFKNLVQLIRNKMLFLQFSINLCMKP